LLKLPLETVIATLKILELSLQLLIVCQETFNVGVAWSPHGFLDIFIHVSWFFWLLVESDENLG
jgi:hypothetical protein